MKTRNRLYDKSRLRLFCLLTALLGLFGAGQTWAGNPTTLTVGGTDVLSGGYWLTNADGTLTTDGASADNYNVHYDAAGTLTLNNATITGTSSTTVGAGIYADGGDLTIVLEGSSTVMGAVNENYDSQSIRVEKNLTIQGGGSLTAKGADTTDDCSSYGIYVGGSFTQQGGNVTAIGGTCKSSRGLYVSVYTGNGTVTVQSGTLTATGGVASSSSYGIYISGTIGNNMTVTVSDATVTATGDTGKYSYGLYMDSSSPSVTLSGSGSLTARSGSATSKSGGIYFYNMVDNTGSVTVEDNFTLLANSVILYARDISMTEKPLAPTGDGSWLIYGQSDQPSAVGGTYTLEENFTIESGNTFTIPSGSTLKVPEDVILTVDGTLINQGTLSIADETCLTVSGGSLQGDGSFTVNVDEAKIVVPAEGVTCANYEKKVVLEGTTLFGQVFTGGGWTLTFTKGAVTLDKRTYTVTASKEGSESIERTFTAQHSFGEDGKCACGAARPTQDDEGRYQLADAFQLRWFAALVNGTLTDGTKQNAAASAVLTKSIDLTGENWTPIGNASTIYTGTFDGAGYTISNLKVDNSSTDYQGFVGYLGTGTIKNLTLGEDCSVTGGKNSGGICGWNNEGTISGCTNKGAVNGRGDLGGICGHNLGTVENCANTGKVTNSGAETVGGICGYSSTSLIGCTNSGVIDGGDQRHVGGICGFIDNGDKGVTVSVCTNTGAVTGNKERVGGICGFGDVTITNCWNSGAITGGTNVGGICGENHSKAGTIMNCYSTGEVKGTDNVGGICGENNRTVDNSYWLKETCDAGIGNSSGTATEKSEDDFKSGAVAYLLQGDQTTQAWGQTLGTDDYPVLTTDEAMRVYAAKLYKGSAENVSELYKNASGISSPEEPNALLVIEGAPSASAGTNIVMKNGNAYTCANLVLTDGADFYTPVAFTAAQATYSRPLAEGTQWGTVALPFDATTVTDAELFRVDRQEGDALYVDETSAMAGGEPLVFRANAGVTEVVFKGADVTVRATDAEAGSTLLKGTSQTVSPLDAGSYFIYGDKFYQVASGSQVGVKPFRAYIPAAAGDPTRSRSAGAASQLRIVFNADK